MALVDGVESVREHRRMGWMLAAWTVLLGVGGCRDIGGPEDLQETGIGVVSDPSPSPSAAGRAGAGAPGVAAGVDVAYVSLRPGTIPDGERATLHNPRNGVVVTTGMEEGGFDPVPIEAAAGDTVEIDVRVSGSTTPIQLSYEVPVRRRPIVVRTNPTPQKRDVPLNASIVIVFSEPVDPTTLTAGAVSVRRGSQVAPGRLEFRDPARLVAAFVPTAPLAPDTDHELVITQAIKDQDGDPLEASIVVEFTTTDLAGRIVFTRFEGGAGIYVMDADGYGPTRLTAGEPRSDPMVPPQNLLLAPVWSPDGRRIAFERYINDGFGIYVMNADGSSVTRLSPDSAQDGQPAWSPDGGKIAFSAIGASRDPEWFASHIYVMNADGSGVTQLTADSASDISPTWSPDGRKIAFSRSPPFAGAGHGIYIMNADGSGITSVTEGSASVSDQEPAWSPDGSRIAFARATGGQLDIYVMNVDGSQARKLSNSAGNDGSPAWSPDGTKIAFSAQLGDNEIYVINADGSRERRLTFGGLNNGHPSWTR
jgi:Tol biopolymer transport system component